MKSKGQMSQKERFGYSAGVLIRAIPSVAVNSYLIYHMSEIMKLPPGLIGTLFLVAKITSAVVAPFVGFYSDRLDTRWGRKRPLFLFGSVPLAVTFFLLFVHPDFSGRTAATVWAASILLMFNIFMVCVEIPYKALLPSLAKDYHERTLIFFYQIPFSLVEVLIAFVYLHLVLKHGSDFVSKVDLKSSIIYLGGFFSVALLIVIPAYISFRTTKEPLYREWGERENFISTLKSLKENKPFFNLIVGFFLVSCGYLIFNNYLPFFSRVFDDVEALNKYAPFVFFGTLFLGMFAWYFISKKIGKRGVCIVGISIYGISLVLFYFADILGIYGIFGCMSLLGLGYSSVMVFTFSMLPDTVEYDCMISGVRRDGLYYGIWSLVAAFNVLFIKYLIAFLFKFIEYSPGFPSYGEPMKGIKLMMGPISALLAFAGLYFFYRYSLTKEKYEEVLAKIESRSLEGSSNT